MAERTGPKLKFKTVKTLQTAIDRYFKICADRKRTVVTKQGKKVVISCPKMPTVTGLALYLKTNRQTLINYTEREGYADVILMAKAKIEAATEDGLFEKDTFKGAQFSLSNNFNWAEKKEVDGKQTITVVSTSYAGASQSASKPPAVKIKKPAPKPRKKRAV